MDLHALITDIENALANLKAHVLGDGADLAKTAERDGEQLAHDAETAAAPVITEAENDARGLAAEAAADLSATVVTDIPPAADTTAAPAPAPAAEQDTPTA